MSFFAKSHSQIIFSAGLIISLYLTYERMIATDLIPAFIFFTMAITYIFALYKRVKFRREVL